MLIVVEQRWVFQCFQAVHLVTLNGIMQISNLTPEHHQILQFLGSACGRYYPSFVTLGKEKLTKT